MPPPAALTLPGQTAEAEWRKRLDAAHADFQAGRRQSAIDEAAAIHQQALVAARPDLASEAAMTAAKASFNGDRMAVAAHWGAQALACAQAAGVAALQAAAQVMVASIHAKMDEPREAIDALVEAGHLLGPDMPAAVRRTVHIGTDVTYGALGLWRAAADASRAAVEADRALGVGLNLVHSRLGHVESLLRAYDDLVLTDAEVAAHLLTQAAGHVQDMLAAEDGTAPSWPRHFSRRMRGAILLRQGHWQPALELISLTLADIDEVAPDAQAAAWLDRAIAHLRLGDADAARKAARKASRLLSAPRGGERRPLTELQILWQAESMAGRPRVALQLLQEYHQRVIRNAQALLDAQVAGLVRQISAQSLLLQNADLREANAGLERDVQDISRLALTDALTGVLNRRALEEHFAEFQNQVAHLVVVMVDIDHFKSVNDQHSHAVGDAVLQRVARLLADSLRSPDRVGRYGGEEFVVLLPNIREPEGWQVAERLRQRVADDDWSQVALGLQLTLSAGLTSASPGEAFDAVIARADALLYRAKREGRNRVLLQVSTSAER